MSVAWDEASFTESAGDAFQVTLTGTLSDGTTCSVTQATETLVGDEAVLRKDGTGYYTGLAAGSTTLSVDTVDTALLDIGKAVNDTVIQRFSVPSVVLPSPLPVTIT